MNFYNWAIENGYKEDLTIDRIDVNKNYMPSNCRWATYKEQSNNRSCNHLITYEGKTKTMSQWCEEKNITFDSLKWRLKNGWSIENALNTPTKIYNRNGGQ